MTPKILSIDDSTTLRQQLARLFSSFDCEWLETASGEDGLAVAIREKPDLIILENHMRLMDGIALLRRLRQAPGLRRTPVSLIPPESGPESLGTVARLRVRDYVTKPFREEELLAKACRIVPLTPREEHDSEVPPVLGASKASLS